ncbi:MAG: amidohydrolase family protein [Planctomycetia bacterium]|nr:amidohydrolase family protein [Planctomycetia bacterium]
MLVDAHTHVFCWGENPADGYLSERTRKSWLTYLLMKLIGIAREPGETLSDKTRSRLLRQVHESRLDRCIVLAQDAVYREDGSRDDAATHFYVSNDYVLDLARRSDRILAGCSINPWRSDALAELERCRAAGSRLVKIHTAIQGVDPSLARFDPFYALARDLGVVLMFHTGYEHSCTVRSQQFTDPTRLARPLDHGGTVIAAHCGTCAWFDPENYYPRFIRIMQQHDNLYGDTAIMANLLRWSSLRRLSGEPADLRGRIVHGSDYPFPPARLPYLNRIGLFPPERRNPLDLDLRIKESFNFGPGYGDQVLRLMGLV